MNHINSPDNSDSAVERAIVAKGKTAPRVTHPDILENIASSHYFNAADAIYLERAHRREHDKSPLQLLTFCVLVLKNGFVVTGESACASPENFDAEIGRSIARQNAEQKIWPLMGYELKTELSRPVLSEADSQADMAGTPRPVN